ncbi:MAG: hypothetical protein RL208_616, partial [Pseudomonadota bacterium]
FPVLYIMLSGNVNKNELIKHAKTLKKNIENIKGILEVKIAGDKNEVVEIIPDIAKMRLYNIIPGEIAAALARNNLLIPLGKISNDKTSLNVKISGLIKNINDIKETPIRTVNNSIIKIKDIGNVTLSHRDNKNIARVNGEDAVVIEVAKRSGVNAIETIQSVQKTVNNYKSQYMQKENINVTFSRDVSKDIMNSLEELENTIIFASLLVVLITILFIGKKQSLIVISSIPISFLLTIGTMHLLGYTLNVVSLFGLILATGMIVDASIIVVEYADNLIHEGMEVKQAYIKAAGRMAIPVLSATIGIIIVYLPLLSWPGIVGKFMKYIPIAIISVLSYSILCALFLVPVMGAFIEKTRFKNLPSHIESNLIDKILAIYKPILERILNNPKKFVNNVIYVVIATFIMYQFFGHGVDFFPSSEPKNINISASTNGNISTKEKLEIAKEIEQRVLSSKISKDIYVYYNKVIVNDRSLSEDIINIADIELKDWDKRRKAKYIISHIKALLGNINGLNIKIEEERNGPSTGKPIKIYLSAPSFDKLAHYTQITYNIMNRVDGLIDIDDNAFSKKTELFIDFDKNMGSLYNMSMIDMYAPLAMITEGYIVGKFKPDNLDSDMDILIRYPKEERKITSLENVQIPIYNKINNSVSNIDINKVATIQTQKENTYINKVNGLYTVTINANVKSGVIVDQKVKEIKNIFDKMQNKDNVQMHLSGDAESQKEAGSFLLGAFSTAIFIKFVILVLQYNSIYYSLLTLSAVLLSVSGILVMLLATFKTFGIVMSGLGIISVAGVVVSNNIIFIDTFQELINHQKMAIKEAIIHTAISRLRPILATALTAIAGLVPMVFNISIDFFHFKIIFNSPAGQMWEQLSATIAGGLIVSTALTLTFTPAMLMIKAPRDEDW